MIKDYVVDNKVTVIVKPNSKKNEILGFADGRVKIAVAAPADKDKANKELIKFFNKEFKTRIRIIKGIKSREKVLEIVD